MKHLSVEHIEDVGIADRQRASVRGSGATALLALAVLVFLTGCGGGSSTADPIITKAELIKKGDAICRQTDVIQRRRFAAYKRQHEAESLTAVGPREMALSHSGLPPIATEIEGIAALGIPAGEEGEVNRIIDGWRVALKNFEENPSLLLGLTEGPFIQPDKLAKSFGFKDCAKAI